MAEVLESTQLAFFPSSPAGISPTEIAKALFDKVPERIETRPGEGLQTAEVPHMGGIARISVNPLRVDVVYEPAPQSLGDDVPLLGTLDIDGVHSWSIEISRKLLSIMKNVARVGVVVVRSESFATQPESLVAFRRSIGPDASIPGDVQDPVLQFAVRRHSELAGGEFNLMRMWQCGTQQRLMFANGLPNQSTVYFFRSVVDANSPAAEEWSEAALNSHIQFEFVAELVDSAFLRG